jgi:hypothetical protein
MTNAWFRQVDEESLAKRVEQMNATQRKIYDEVIGLIAHQEEHRRNVGHCDTVLEPLFRFISGLAGDDQNIDPPYN